MDQWLKVHVANEGDKNGPATMGYYEEADIPVHRALADAFTICDHYHCSVLGPTDPNRLYWISGMLDPEGKHGGPLLDTPTLIPTYQYTWRTFPENLEEAGVSWKIYNDTPASSIRAQRHGAVVQAVRDEPGAGGEGPRLLLQARLPGRRAGRTPCRRSPGSSRRCSTASTRPCRRRSGRRR